MNAFGINYEPNTHKYAEKLIPKKWQKNVLMRILGKADCNVNNTKSIS